MKWMLIVVVFGLAPVKTNLLFDSIDDCLRAEDVVRNEYARTFNEWKVWAEQNPVEAGYPNSKKMIIKRNGLMSPGTCIPYAEFPSLPD